jgi:hypothetical protein
VKLTQYWQGKHTPYALSVTRNRRALLQRRVRTAYSHSPEALWKSSALRNAEVPQVGSKITPSGCDHPTADYQFSSGCE